MADPYSKQEIDELRSPAVSWQYLDARRIVATWDTLRQQVASLRERLGDSEDNAANKVRDIQKLQQQVAEQQAAIEQMRQRVHRAASGMASHATDVCWAGEGETVAEALDYAVPGIIAPGGHIAETLPPLDATQHDGQALREVRAEAVDNYREMVCAVAHEEILWLPANPHRQPQAEDSCPACDAGTLDGHVCQANPTTTTTDGEG